MLHQLPFTFILGMIMVTSRPTVLLVMFLCSHSAGGIPLADFYPFGAGTTDTLLFPNDDDSSPAVMLTLPFPYFESDYTSIFVSRHELACKCTHAIYVHNKYCIIHH